ncbi:MAG: hypothetical protein ACI9YR_002509 [Bacteroidia bacterium]|jgi:hypothetical protein
MQKQFMRRFKIMRYANNQAKRSHEPARTSAQCFVDAHAAVYNVFNLSRRSVSVEHYRYFRLRAFAT